MSDVLKICILIVMRSMCTTNVRCKLDRRILQDCGKLTEKQRLERIMYSSPWPMATKCLDIIPYMQSAIDVKFLIDKFIKISFLNLICNET